MPSRADTPRIAAEYLLRVISIVLLVLLLLRVLHPEHDGPTTTTTDSRALRSALPTWTITAPAELHLTLRSVPAPRERDWLRALARAGTSLTWDGARIPATAVTIARLADPVPMWRLAVAAPRGARVLLRDNAGVIDTIQAAGAGIRAVLPSLVQPIAATVDSTSASTAVVDSVVLKRLLVEGMAGWETKFAIAALQERGWTVDALTHVAPGVDVREGSPSRPDTARYAAVIAIDSSATLIAVNVVPYVRSGGGLITMRDAANIGPSGSSALVLEKRPDGAVTAFRAGSGRVLHIGYADVWRTRLASDDTTQDPAVVNRAWWAGLVAGVAYAPRDSLHMDEAVDPAPLAGLVDRIGAATAATAAPASVTRSATTSRYAIPTYLLLAMLVTTLLLEWASRRLRGEA